MDDVSLRVAGLWIYPVKSLAGVAVDAAHAGPLGLEGDRRWMLVDADDRFLSQREHPGLALGRARVGAGGTLTLEAPGRPPLAVAEPGPDAPRRRVHIWSDAVRARDAGDEAAAWLTAWLGRPARLVHFGADARRRVDGRYAARGDQTAFSDGFPVLVATQASLDDLNRRLADAGAASVGIERFRPNVLLDAGAGAPPAPYAEDGWAGLEVGGGGAGPVRLALVKPCGRCVMTTVDPARGRAAGPEPLRTLAGYRRRGNKVLFAQNAIVRAEGLLRVGDGARVTAAPAVVPPAPVAAAPRAAAR